MKILIACEESQAVTKAFRNKGYETYSCDILECSGGHPEWHIQADAIKEAYSGKYDMMIAFPPCTHLASSGARWFKEKQKDGRQQQGIDFFMELINAPIDRIAVENPVGIMSSKYRKPNQIIQPFQFGHDVSKKTCLWLKNLPNLTPTKIVKPDIIEKNGYKMSRHHWETFKLPSKIRGKVRSRFYEGIADAMADQWGSNETI